MKLRRKNLTFLPFIKKTLYKKDPNHKKQEPNNPADWQAYWVLAIWLLALIPND
jgi:hypothetical protein